MAHGNLGMKRTMKTRRQMSEAAKRRWDDPEEREKQAERAREQFGTPEHREKMRLSMLGNNKGKRAK